MESRLYNLRRAEQERRKSALALTEAARRFHLELAEIFEVRAGVSLVVTEGSNVIQLRPKNAPDEAAEEPAPKAAGSRRKQGRRR